MSNQVDGKWLHWDHKAQVERRNDAQDVSAQPGASSLGQGGADQNVLVKVTGRLLALIMERWMQNMINSTGVHQTSPTLAARQSNDQPEVQQNVPIAMMHGSTWLS